MVSDPPAPLLAAPAAAQNPLAAPAKPSPAPPLPTAVRDELLSFLVPPRPPLPPPLLSRAFLARLAFLPPPPDDQADDAHLSPMAKDARNPHALHSALSQLAGAVKVHDTDYAHDGEASVARARLTPQWGAGAGYGYGDEGVDAFFEHEDGDQGRGWVYRGAAPAGAVGSNWDWKARVDDVFAGGYGFEDTAPEDYWAGFTPPGARAASLPDDDDGDDHYWAQYGAGAADTHSHDEQDPHEAEPVTPPQAALPAPDPAATLSLLLSGLGVQPNGNDEGASSASASPDLATTSAPTLLSAATVVGGPAPASTASSPLAEKLVSKVRAQLNRAWSSFSRGQDAESSAYEWLRAARTTADRPSWSAAAHEHDEQGFGDVRPAVLRARLAAAKDVHDLLDRGDGEEEGDAFFRLCEAAIRCAPPPQGDEQPFEYES